MAHGAREPDCCPRALDRGARRRRVARGRQAPSGTSTATALSSSASRRPPATRASAGDRREADRRERLRAGADLRAPGRGRCHDRLVLRAPAPQRGPGLGLRRLPRRHRPDECACGHDRRPGRWPGPESTHRLCPVLRRRPGPGADRRLRPLRRRRGRPRRPEAATRCARCRSATRRASSSAHPWRRSGARSATSDSLSVGVVSAIRRSIPSLTTQLRPDRRDPDRRADQPRQLGRAPLRRRAAG